MLYHHGYSVGIESFTVDPWTRTSCCYYTCVQAMFGQPIWALNRSIRVDVFSASKSVISICLPACLRYCKNGTRWCRPTSARSTSALDTICQNDAWKRNPKRGLSQWDGLCWDLSITQKNKDINRLWRIGSYSMCVAVRICVSLCKL